MLNKIFKFQKDSKPSSGITENINRRISAEKKRVAAFLNRKTASWSRQRQKMVLIAFCIIAGSYCFYAVMQVFVQTNGPPNRHKTNAPTLRQRQDSLRGKPENN